MPQPIKMEKECAWCETIIKRDPKDLKKHLPKYCSEDCRKNKADDTRIKRRDEANKKKREKLAAERKQAIKNETTGISTFFLTRGDISTNAY